MLPELAVPRPDPPCGKNGTVVTEPFPGRFGNLVGDVWMPGAGLIVGMEVPLQMLGRFPLEGVNFGKVPNDGICLPITGFEPDVPPKPGKREPLHVTRPLVEPGLMDCPTDGVLELLGRNEIPLPLELITLKLPDDDVFPPMELLDPEVDLPKFPDDCLPMENPLPPDLKLDDPPLRPEIF